MTNDIGSPLALIAAILERHDSNLQSISRAGRPAPAFDPQYLRCSHELPHLRETVIQQVSSWGLPDHVSTEVTAFLSEEFSKYQTFVQSTRAEILGQLIETTLAVDPSVIPSLVESTCDVVYRSTIDNMLSRVQQQVESFSLNGMDVDLGEDSSSESASEDESEDGDNDDGVLEEAEGEEDNAPIRPGEEVPPLETKYLPIFEALHERGKVLTKPEKTYLVNMTGMTYRQITIWFQNRRRGELKESMNTTVSYSKASSTHSDESSESEQELENKLGAYPPNATFDIRSWRLQSALATKDDDRESFPPLSPFKYNFRSTADAPDTESDTDLSDDGDNLSVPPGLQAPSLTTSVTTVDSISTNGTSINVAKGPGFQPSIAIGDAPLASKEVTHTRPIRSLPASKRGDSSQQTQHRGSHSLDSQNPIPQHQSQRFSDTVHSPSRCVTSNENGLTVNLPLAAQLQTSTLRSSPVSVPLVSPGALVPGAPSVSPSPPPISVGSPQRHLSPNSPRPHIKPLPRRTGCAPRPRPPPRSGSSAPTSVTALSSSRPSVVLPPSSNPSLGSTTLGALLRPNLPAPAIPQEIEERLTAMAGRMGVGASFVSDSGARQGTPPNTPHGGTLGNGAFPGRSTLFSFGPTSLPRTGTQPVSGQTTQGLTNVPPSSR
ncbi:unnamed protein product [Rhizoctonia solani]|uniref:Homeobox domain-containing protein n=1 Tax=Rhizoctonia solani TaxID=456999 RepID=A0A8H3HQE3_9AGAM|nr:unnamed protein product [Rhizoctonia solani]